jgi:hypothetical protein
MHRALSECRTRLIRRCAFHQVEHVFSTVITKTNIHPFGCDALLPSCLPVLYGAVKHIPPPSTARRSSTNKAYPNSKQATTGCANAVWCALLPDQEVQCDAQCSAAGRKSCMPKVPFSLSFTRSCEDYLQRVTMFTFIVLSFLSLWASQIHAQIYDVFKITAPKSGDTVTTSKYTTEGVSVPIEWTVLDELADRPVMISLV